MSEEMQTIIPKELEDFRGEFEEAIRDRAQAAASGFRADTPIEDVLRSLEQTSGERSRFLPKPAFLVMAAPTAVGKTTIGNELEKMRVRRFPRYTTRGMREGEVDGKDYLFVTMAELLEKERTGKLLMPHSETYGEGRGMDRQLFWDWVNEGQVFYIDGSTRTPLDFRNHKEKKVREVPLMTVELLPPSFDEWMRRMVQSRSLDEVVKRLPTAIEQIKQGGETVDVVLINDQVERVIGRLGGVLSK